MLSYTQYVDVLVPFPCLFVSFCTSLAAVSSLLLQ